MALDPRFVLAPGLQEAYIDKDTGLPLAGGIITYYSDQNRTQLKPVYEISGTPPNYVYVPLPNPLTLSGVGTIQDGSGNDVKPYYFPYDGTPNNSNGDIELYYITVESAGLVLQFTREGWPNTTGIAPGDESAFNRVNYLVNNVFLRNIGATALPIASPADLVLAPGAHSSFVEPDIRFIKPAGNANDQISFIEFGQGEVPFSPDATPEWYLNYNCSNVPVGETVKYVHIPIQPKVKTIEGQSFTFDIWAQGVSGTQSLIVQIEQFFGTGGAPSTTVLTPIGLGSIPLSAAWTQYSATVTIPLTDGKVLGTTGDDATSLRIGFPVNVSCQVNFVKPKLYVGAFVPLVTDFETNDQIDAVINSVRCGDVRTAYNSFSSNPQVGWVPMNDGTIGSSTSLATTRANIDTFFLYKTLWENVSNNFAPVTGGRGANAGADFSANKALQLTRMLGRVMAGVISPQLTQTWTETLATTTMTVASTVGFYTGAPVKLTSTGPLPTTTNPIPNPFDQIFVGRTYYARLLTATTMSIAQTAEDAIAGVNLFTFTVAGAGVHSVTVASRELGEFLGKEFQNIADMPSHTHTGIVAVDSTRENGGGGPVFLTNGFENGGHQTFNFGFTTNATGGDSPIGQMQPTSYVNVFIKL